MCICTQVWDVSLDAGSPCLPVWLQLTPGIHQTLAGSWSCSCGGLRLRATYVVCEKNEGREITSLTQHTHIATELHVCTFAHTHNIHVPTTPSSHMYLPPLALKARHAQVTACGESIINAQRMRTRGKQSLCVCTSPFNILHACHICTYQHTHVNTHLHVSSPSH